jgi:hypothetical protein
LISLVIEKTRECSELIKQFLSLFCHFAWLLLEFSHLHNDFAWLLLEFSHLYNDFAWLWLEFEVKQLKQFTALDVLVDFAWVWLCLKVGQSRNNSKFWSFRPCLYYINTSRAWLSVNVWVVQFFWKKFETLIAFEREVLSDFWPFIHIGHGMNYFKMILV